MPSYSIKTPSSDEETDHKYPLRNKTQNGRVIDLVSPKPISSGKKPPKQTTSKSRGENGGKPTTRRNSTSIISSKSNDDIPRRVLRSSTSSSKSKPLVFGEDVEDNKKLTSKLDNDSVGSDDDSVGSDEAVGPFQYGLNTPPTVEYKLGSEDGTPTVHKKSFWSDHREPKVYASDTSSTESEEDKVELESYTAEPMSSPDEADAAYAAGLIHGDEKSLSLSPHVKAVIKQVAADDADSDDDDSDEEDSEDVDTSFNQVTSPSSLVNKFSPTILTHLSEEEEDKDPTDIDIDEDKENRSDTKELPNEQSYTPLSISNEEQSYAPLSIPNKSVADFFDKNPTNQPDTTEVQEQARKQYTKVLEELKQRGVGDSNLMAKEKATELTEKILSTQNNGELSSKATVVKTPFLQPRLSHQGNDNFSQELDAGTQRGAATVETPVEIAHLFLETPSNPDKKGSGGGGRAKYRADTPFNSKAVTFADNKLGRWTSPNDEDSSVDADDAKNKVSSYTPVPYNSKTATFSAPTLDDDEESENTDAEKEASPASSPNPKPGVFTAPLDESSPLSGYELVESPKEGKATNTSVMWPTDEKRATTTNKSPTETINLTNQFDVQPALVLQDLLDMSYVASTPDASSCNVHHKRRVMFIIRHKKVAEDMVAMILRNDGHEIELMNLAEKFDRFM